MKATCRALACAAVCCLCGCALFTREPDPNVLTQQEEVNGWILLWDGDVPTNGWVGVSAGCSNFTARGWSVTNGALVASVGADAIRTADSYKDFDFKVDYRLAPGASGRILYFHNAESDADSAFAYALAPLPPEAKEFVDRTRDFPHKIDREDLCYRLFREHGFSWGGAWTHSKDYQHFQK